MQCGLNLTAVDYFAANCPFLNIAKTGNSWTPASGTAAAYTASLDANGYPNKSALTAVGSASFVVFRNYASVVSPAYYQAGVYAWLYDGTGTFTFAGDVASSTKVSEGRYLVTINTPSNTGLTVTQTGTDLNSDGNYAKNFFLVYAPAATSGAADPNETTVRATSSIVTGTANNGAGLVRLALNSVPSQWATGTKVTVGGVGGTAEANGRWTITVIDATHVDLQGTAYSNAWTSGGTAGDLSKAFAPGFQNIAANFKCLRFMDWLRVNSSLQQNWSDRPTVNWMFWNDDLKFNQGFGNGSIVPFEVCVAICNAVGADGWFNSPPLATTSYVTSMAALINQSLDPALNAYHEYWNEVWNNVLHGHGLDGSVSSLGATQFPSISSDAFSCRWAYGVYRAVTFGAIWKAALGTRGVRLLGGQIGNNDLSVTYMLPMLASSYGAIDPTAWSGAAGANVDAYAVAPYANFDTSFAPAAWTDTAVCADGGVANFLSVMWGPNTVIPDGSSSTTATAVGGGALGANWTAIQVAAGPGTLTNGTTICVNIPQSAATSGGLTLKANDGTAYPIQDPNGTAMTAGFGAQTINFVWTNKTGDGVVATAGWRYCGVQPSGGTVSTANGFSATAKTTASSYGLTLVAYECGQQYAPGTGSSALAVLGYNANMAAGMGTGYTGYFTSMASQGYSLVNHYTDISSYSGAGSYWGLVDNYTKSSSAKLSAILSFMSSLIHHGGRGLGRF